MDEKRIAQRLEEIPSTQLPEVLRLASELYAKDRAAIEQAEQRHELMNAAAEAGLPPEYLEQAAARLQSQRTAPEPERQRRRPHRIRLVWMGIALLFAFRAMHRLASPPPALMPPPAPIAAVTLGPTFPVNLRPFVNQQLTDSMLATPGNDLSQLLAGVADSRNPQRTLSGITFNLDGVVLVGPGETSSGDGVRVAVKPEVDGIPINRKAQRLHFLQATHWHPRDGTLVGAYIVHYVDGTRTPIPLRYGEEVADWWTVDDGTSDNGQTHVAWRGHNGAAGGRPIRLFVQSWENPRPEVPIRSLDMVTGSQTPGREAPALFLAGLTVEGAGASPGASPYSGAGATTSPS